MSDMGDGLEAFYEAVAYHEAGHAVAACALGCPFELVTIVPDLSAWAAGGLKWEGLAQSEVMTIGPSEGSVDRAISCCSLGRWPRPVQAAFDQVWFVAGACLIGRPSAE